MRGRVSTLIFAALFPALAGAQAPEAQDDFGTSDVAITIVGFADFVSENGNHGTSFGTALRWDVSGGFVTTPMNMLPNGAFLEEVVFYFRDTNPAMNMVGQFCASELDSSSGSFIGQSCAEVSSAGEPGDAGMKIDTQEAIRYRLEVAGAFRIRHYSLSVSTPAGDDTTAIRAVRLLWRRQVSPAPLSATFGDVPTNHSFFQFIEALADSGITAGCQAQPPLFCPDRTLTRGEMAVFLAKALGLHWPWDVQ